MTTQRLYYDDPYTLTFAADVVEVTTFKDHPALILDRTYFYPEGGGQPPDHGMISGVRVLDVQTRDADRAVLHILEHDLHITEVECEIDAVRRQDYMQHHSGQHILSQALWQAAGAETISVHMSAESMTIDVNRGTIPPEDLANVEDLANRVVMENRSVRAWFPEADELAEMTLRKLPDGIGKVRVIDMGGFDVTACGGTHVIHTGEIGVIKLVRVEKHGSGTRVEFKCGWRALHDYRDKNTEINHLSSSLTVGYWELNNAVTRLSVENKTLASELKAAQDQLLDTEAVKLINAATLHGDYRVLTCAFENRDVAEIRRLAQKLRTAPKIIFLAGSAGEKAQLIFGRSADVDLDVVPLLKSALKSLGSERGGGQPSFAQGGGVPATLAQIETAIRTAAALIPVKGE